MNLHPISQILNICLTEKEGIASKAYVDQIKYDFIFTTEEIQMISLQLYNNLQISIVIPKDRFNVEFKTDFLKQILENNKTSQNVLFILLSCISWLINVDKTLNANNFDLILDLLDTLPDEIGINTILSNYKLTNYLFQFILNLNIEYSFHEIKKQTIRFLNRYSDLYKTELINDTFLNWLTIGYSFEKQTSFAQSILSQTSLFAQKNPSLFTETIFKNILKLIKYHLSVFDRFELCFLINIASLLSPEVLFNYFSLLIQSILPYFETKNHVQYEIFDKNQYIQSIASDAVYDLPQVTSYSLQFSSFKYSYQDEIYLFPYINVDPNFTFSNQIFEIIKYLYRILESGKIDLNQFNPIFQNILSICMNEKQIFFFDFVAAILSFAYLFGKYDSSPVFQILIDSPLFDEQLTIFTENSENESVHKLRMMSYYLLVFQNELNIQLFFATKMKFPLMIAEFFYYGINSKKYKFTIPQHILESGIFLNQISNSLLVCINKEGCNKKLDNSRNQQIDLNSSNIIESSYNSISESNVSIKNVNNSSLNSINDLLSNNNNNDSTSSFSLNNNLANNTTQKGNICLKEIQDPTKQSISNLNINDNSNIFLSSEIESSSQILPNFNISGLYDSFSSNTELSVSLESFKSNSIQNFNLNSPRNSNVNAPKNYQSAQFLMQKIHHRNPIDDSKNHFLKWFNAINSNDYEIKRNSVQGNNKFVVEHFLQCALVNILAFISKIIENDVEIASFWNESADLVPTLFSLLFNEYTRPIILNILYKIWISSKSSIKMASQSCVLTIFKQNYDDDFCLLDFQLLETINKYLFNRLGKIIEKYDSNESVVFMNDANLLEIIEPFNEMYQIIASILTNCDISSDFLHQSMLFYSFNPKPIEKTARASISSALSRIEGKDPNIRFYHDFILIITSFNNKDESPQFLITQPKMVSIFIESFSGSKYLRNIFDFIESLCEHSVANTLSCHNGNVDTSIIRFIYKYKESELIQNALRLFERIGLMASSIPVVSQFISLFCPIKSNFSPPYISDCIQTLSSIICKKYSHPTAYLPISKKSPYVEIFKLTGSKINQGFTFVAKLFIDKFAKKYQTKLLSISYKTQILNVIIADDQITIYDSQDLYTFENLLPINNWFKVAITFVPSQSIAQCHILNQAISTIHFKFPSFGNFSTLSCEVGNGKTSDIFIAHATLIGGFSLYPLSSNYNNNNNISSESFANSNEKEVTPDFIPNKKAKIINESAFFKFQIQDSAPWISINFDIDQSLLHMVIESRQSDLDASLVGNNLIISLSFPDVLVKFFKAEILIPLFAQIGFPIYSKNDDLTNLQNAPPNKESHDSFSKSIINLLSSTVQLNYEVQESFVQSQGFRIISYLLMNTLDASILTFDFYMHFFLLFENLSVEKLKIQLFYHILLNADIWCLASQKVYQQIIHFWAKGLFTENQELFLLLSPIFKLVQKVTLFYERMKIETEKIKMDYSNELEKNGAEINPNEVNDKNTRELIINLLYSVAQAKFTENDFNALFMMCIAPPYLMLSKDLLILIQMLAKLDNSPLLQFSVSKRNVLFIALDALLAFNDEEIVLLTIETIFILHRREIIHNFNLFSHIEIIMMNVRKSLANESFITKLIEISQNSIPEVLPIPFFLMLSSLSSSYLISESTFSAKQQLFISIISKNLKPNPKYAINKLWFLWPLIFAIKNDEITDFMIQFIILSTLKDWENLFVSINIVSSCLDLDPIPIQRNFLIILAQCFLQGLVTENITQFFDLTLYFIFTKSIDKQSFAMQCLYKDSIFYKECNKDNLQKNFSGSSSNPNFDLQGNIKDSESDEQNKVQINNNGEINESIEVDRKNSFFDIDVFLNKVVISSKTLLDGSKYKYMLDVDKEGNWLDQKLSEYFIEIFAKYKDKIDISQYINFIRYINSRNTTNKIPSEILFDIYKSRLSLVDHIASRIQHISVFIIKNREDAIKLNKIVKEKIDKACNDSYIYIARFNQRKHVNKRVSHKLWSDLWRLLTNDRSPWRNSLPLSETHFKRSNRNLAYFCPVKLKRNLSFTNHKDASLNREYGSSEVAREKLAIYQEQLKEKLKKEAPPPLLSVSHSQYTNDDASEFINNNDDVSLLDIQNYDFDILNTDQEALFYFSHCYNDYHSSMQSHQQQSESNQLFDQKKITEQKNFYPAKLLTMCGQKKIIFGIYPSRFIIIIYKENEKSHTKQDKIKIIEASDVNYILFRSYLHLGKALEIVKKSGKSYLIDLKHKRSLELLQKISEYQEFKHAFIQTVPPIEFVQSLNIQSKWSKGLITNFEYLMMLNFLGGRTFNEAAMYPVFPWIIQDYSSSKINLEDPSIYRNLSLPIGAMNEDRLRDLKKHLQDYISFRDVGFLYNSCYISPLCVYLWLIRVEPFTTLHIELQSGRFDYSTRIFTSIPAAYNMITNHMNDYRELIPEFFYTSSFLENRNHFDLGVLHEKVVDDVILPKWSKSAIDFIYIHRKALESDYINEHLNEWIDLIFGDCQKGQKAQERNNTFDPSLYEDIWVAENTNDEGQRKMIKAVLKHCGHIPNQLFTHPHPKKQRFIVDPIASSMSFSPSDSFPKSSFVNLYTCKSQNPKSYCIKKCLFISNDGIISIATLKTDFESKQTYYQILAHPSLGTLSPTSTMLSKKRKIEKTASASFMKASLSSSYDDDNVVRIDPEKLKINMELANVSSKCGIFAFNPKNSLLVFATSIGAIIITQLLVDSKREMMLTRHVGRVNCVAISDNFIVSGGSDTSINIWSTKRDIQLKKVQVEASTIPLSSMAPKTKSRLSFLGSDKKFSSNSSFSSSAAATNKGKRSFKIVDDSFSSPISHLKTIQSFRNEITCIDISEKFGTIASGTKDGSIILIDTASLENTVTIDISPEVPLMVKITSCWGFVVVYSSKEHEGRIKSYISVFDIDGRFVRKRHIRFGISCWTNYASMDGFDYMVIGSINPSSTFQNVKENEDEANDGLHEKPISYRGLGYNLYLFEVFYLDIEDSGVERSDSRFVELKYCTKKGVLYAVTENGSILVYSANELNTQRFHKTIFGADT